MSRPKDYNVQIKVRNAPLMKMMRANGYSTSAELSRACGVNQTTISAYLNLRKAPIKSDGDWALPVIRMADCLNVIPELLFPERHLYSPIENNTREVEFDWQEMMQLSHEANGCGDPLLDIEASQATEDVNEALEVLGEKEIFILKHRHGFDGEEKSLREIGEMLGLSTERVRQIEQKSLRLLRHPDRAKKLVQYVRL
ncbi:sigma-70 family RNA polymerase sigma factor [Salinisphaera sp. T31B1]|uniref:sigma-70 family RNA polymerase sigma factor n=1 Tax=Salinisphaera sp. T31B1 TaxID=727963 RepID=UPI003342C1FF